MITGFYAGLLGLWLVFLILSVVRLRWKYRVGMGDGGQRELMQAIRIHGNFIETVPFVLILMGLLELRDFSPALLLHGFGVTLLVSRLLHWHGLTRSATTSVGRTVGTVLIVFLVLTGAVLLIFNFVVR
ncbi:MAG: MAPEG family protein [Alphaproteobacteria bacterium]|nr:MAPEG family protein [Alphaproteobacteria bacterium]